VNAWCFSINPLTFGKPYDPYGAQKDIDAGLIRILHDKSFLDDPTRMYRAVRFAGRFGWKLAPKTERLLKEAVREEYPLLLTRERFSREFLKVLKEPKIKEIFALMEKYDLLKFAYPGLHWDDALLRAENVAERTGILVCLLGTSGGDFLRSLHLSKELAQELLGAWKVMQEKMSPLSALSPLQLEILRAVLPGLPSCALEPCFLRGREVKEMGLMGRRISGALDRVRHAQWEGTVKNHDDAVALLKR
jgi:tRNA nucleotidyltransferase/poly(A) polymerase